MESLIWAADLVAVAYLCIWALRQDGAIKPKRGKRRN